MFSMCSELTPRAHVPDNRIPQLMQPCLIDDLVHFEEDFNSQTEMWSGGPVRSGYLRPVQFLDHLTVIISLYKCAQLKADEH